MSGIYDVFGGSLTADVLEFNHDAIPKPDTLVIRMTRGERRVADELHKAFGRVMRVVIDVDGERHEYDADALIRLLEGYEGAHDKSRWHQLFGTPERAARTIADISERVNLNGIGGDYDELLEWLRGDA